MVDFLRSVVGGQSQLSGGFHASGLLARNLMDELVLLRPGERAVFLTIAIGGFRPKGTGNVSNSNDTWGLLAWGDWGDSSFTAGDSGLPGLLTDVNHLSIKTEVVTSVFRPLGDEGAENEGTEQARTGVVDGASIATTCVSAGFAPFRGS